MEATLNVRINNSLKKRGDQVLKDNGISASAAVRALWEELATTKELPAFMSKDDDAAVRKESKKALLREGAGVAKGRLTNASDAELEEILHGKYL